MTGVPPVLDRPALWAALSHMQIQEPGTRRRFEKVLAEQNGWSAAFAERVADEYCGFVYLAATAGFEVTPSQAVDQAWHLHLGWPHYRDVLCGEILGRPLDHRPGTGDSEDEARYGLQYAETLALYARLFGKPPPADIWPRQTGEEARDDLPSARDRGRMLCRPAVFCCLAGSLVSLPFGVPAFTVALLGAALVFFILGQPAGAAARGTNSGNCGGGCGGGGSSDGCAGCGGGGCGGD
ncbi:MAG: glycine-rich domain-containing protein [Allosphingosinicella sp.]